MTRAGVDLFWLPLGAGGRFVAFNGRVYEGWCARRQRRPACDLYHTALEVTVPEGRYVIENAWPIPDAFPDARGVTVQGSVWASGLGRFRVFRYELRRWRDGTISDVGYAVDSPERLTEDADVALNVLELTAHVPAYIWGRDLLGISDMWNSNSVISWLLTRAGVDAGGIRPPDGGRAPGWLTGTMVARNSREPTPVPTRVPERR